MPILPVLLWALTVSWLVGWDKALNLCVSKSKWWILSHLQCLLTDERCKWLTALFPYFFDLKMPTSWGVAMQRYVACRAPEEVSSHMLSADNDDKETHLTSQQMRNSLRDDTCGRWAASTVFVQNQMSGQILDELLEIISAKCFQHLAIKLNRYSLTW